MTTHAAKRFVAAGALALSVLIMALAPGAAAAQPAADHASETAALNNAYALLAAHDIDGAVAVLTTLAAASDLSIRATSQRQLAYTDETRNDRAGAIAALDRYLLVKPADDGAKLERGYDLAGLGRIEEARAVFVALQSSSDPKVAAAARAQVAAMRAARPPAFETFGYAENESRFHDTFYGLDARYRLGGGAIVPYLSLHFTDDAKAAGVPAATILNDDAVVGAFGLQSALVPGVNVFVEGGAAQTLTSGLIESDLRYGVRASRRLGSGGRAAQTEVDASLARYSRYTDAIGYATVAHDFYIGSTLVRGVTGADLALDTSRAYYNNYLDGFAGVQIRRSTVTLRLSGVAGTYLPRGIALPQQRGYTSVNLSLLFGFAR